MIIMVKFAILAPHQVFDTSDVKWEPDVEDLFEEMTELDKNTPVDEFAVGIENGKEELVVVHRTPTGAWMLEFLDRDDHATHTLPDFSAMKESISEFLEA